MYLIINYLASVLIVGFFYLSGVNFSKLFINNTKKAKEKLIDIENLYVFLGFFWYGNILILINYFLPTKYFLFIFFFYLIFFERNEIKNIYRSNKFTLLSLLFLIHSIFNNNPSQDSKIYHFYVQNMISSQKISFGLTNFDPLYGLTSIFDYVASSFWIGNNYGFIQILNLVVLSSFFNFLYINLKTNKKILTQFSLIVIIAGLMDNVGFGGGRNGFLFIQEIGKFDNVYSVIFLISTIIFLVIISENGRDPTNVYLILYFITFLSQLRSMGYLYFIFLFIYLFLAKVRLKVSSYFGFVFLNLIWVLKNFITSSCFLYPLNFTCMPFVDWYWPNQASYLTRRAFTNNRNPNEVIMDFKNFDWVSDYWINENLSYLLNFILTFCVIRLLVQILKVEKNQLKNSSQKLIGSCLISYFIIWFFMYPNYRFVSGVIMSIYVIFNLNYSLNLNFPKFSYITIGLLIIANIFLVRIDSYFSFYSNPSIEINEKFIVNEPTLVKRNNSFGFKSTSIYCYTFLECSNSNQNTNIKLINSYLFYIPINVDLYK